MYQIIFEDEVMYESDDLDDCEIMWMEVYWELIDEGIAGSYINTDMYIEEV